MLCVHFSHLANFDYASCLTLKKLVVLATSSWKVLYWLLENFPLSSGLTRTRPKFRLESWSCDKHKYCLFCPPPPSFPLFLSLSLYQLYKVLTNRSVEKGTCFNFLIGSSFHFWLYICICLYFCVTIYYDRYPKFVPHLYTYPPNLCFFFLPKQFSEPY